MQKTLVIPSIRENSIKAFLEAWEEQGDWDSIILVEDNPTKTFEVDVDAHYSWEEIEKTLQKDAWVISRRDSAIRSFGFMMAYHQDADYILTLDDDVVPYDDRPIFASHIEKMQDQPKWVPSVPDMRTRGLPYQNLGTLNNVCANMGLWADIPDLDAVQSLTNIDFATNGQFVPPTGSRVIPHGQYVPLCGMNFCFKREVMPLTYFPLMGLDQPYSRFDDIWCGVIFKKIIDHLGWHLTVGEPHVRHMRASNMFINLVKEAPGIQANEGFWTMIDSVKLTALTPKDCMIELGADLENNQIGYFQHLGRAIQVWAAF